MTREHVPIPVLKRAAIVRFDGGCRLALGPLNALSSSDEVERYLQKSGYDDQRARSHPCKRKYA